MVIVSHDLPALRRVADAVVVLDAGRVVYAGPTTTFSVDYATIGTYWLIDHANYRYTFSLPLHLMQTTVTVEASMSGFTFPDMPTDPRLR